ncbi:hypothetical protein JOB18_003948 [Solea senegalensis]|uniref:Trichohyalin-like n=2 Tax=Solea senegalensis TaxID=28829 RepID=A0AAV6PII0_SOLSE|nr:hypothetical protein JOB18_003948 [Solea senegalensis]
MEVSALREEVQKEQREKEVQEQLEIIKEEVTVITEEVYKEQREKEQMQEELVKIKEEDLRGEEQSEEVQEEQRSVLQSQESHAEEECLRSVLKEEVEVRRENQRIPREEVLRQRGEVDEEKTEEARMEAEERWRSRVKRMEEEQEVKLRALLGENQMLKEMRSEGEKEVRRDVMESREEIRVTAPMLEEQKTQVFCVQEENEELRRQVYTLTQRTEELEGDRNRVRLALERTEAIIVGYEGRTNQWERSTGAESNPDLHVSDRLTSLHHHVAELELEKTQQSKKISHLENQREKLKRERKTLRDTLREVEKERLRLRQQMMDSCRSQVLTDTTEEEHLRRRVMELEDQVSQLHLLLAVDQPQRAEFIHKFLGNSEWLLSLRHELRDSLAVVTHRPIASVLESEAERLDRSLREEELRMTLSK